MGFDGFIFSSDLELGGVIIWKLNLIKSVSSEESVGLAALTKSTFSLLPIVAVLFPGEPNPYLTSFFTCAGYRVIVCWPKTLGTVFPTKESMSPNSSRPSPSVSCACWTGVSFLLYIKLSEVLGVARATSLTLVPSGSSSDYSILVSNILVPCLTSGAPSFCKYPLSPLNP